MDTTRLATIETMWNIVTTMTMNLGLFTRRKIPRSSEHTGAGMFSGIGFATRPFDIDRLLLGFNDLADEEGTRMLLRSRCEVYFIMLTCLPMSPYVYRMRKPYTV